MYEQVYFHKSLLFFSVVFCYSADADFIIDIVENGSDVVATLSGDFDLNATQGLIATGLPAFSGHAAFVSQIGFSPGLGDAYGLSVTGTPFGPGGFAFWDSVSGDIFDFNILINSAFIAPPGYAGEGLLEFDVGVLFGFA